MVIWSVLGWLFLFVEEKVNNPLNNPFRTLDSHEFWLVGWLFVEEKLDTIIGLVVLLNSLTMVMELECEGRPHLSKPWNGGRFCQ